MSRFSGPPEQVPTLTDVVPGGRAATPAELQELLVRRVLGQIGPLLEQRLQGACERLVREQVQALLPPLLDEIGQVVRESVRQGFEGGQDGHCGTARWPARSPGTG